MRVFIFDEDVLKKLLIEATYRFFSFWRERLLFFAIKLQSDSLF